ncbi:hypothetical protein H0H81_003761 [Sphagnurus paluster]|uniref:Uncharacterized protein n=1 Tax=Sphagnurus paluster TaxID=117069 RepID=A0A9P7GUL3_9AGAR|nr:hypothetical protein H0H81_003761 [Sphagnurus paluster]
MAILASWPARSQFSSILQLVSSPGPAISRHESMEDVYDLARFASSSSESMPDDVGHRSSSSSAHGSFRPPFLHTNSLLPKREFQAGPRLPPLPNYLPKSKGKRPGRLAQSVDYNRLTNVHPAHLPSAKRSIRSKSLSGNANPHRHRDNVRKSRPSLPDTCVDDALPIPTTPHTSSPRLQGSSPLHSPPSTPRNPPTRNPSSRSPSSTGSRDRRKSLDLGSVQAGIRRLKRSPSLWTIHTTYKSSLSDAEGRGRHIQNLRAEPQLTEEQKTLALKRARKITQVFGSEAPTEFIQIPECRVGPSPNYRDSLSTIISVGTVPSPNKPTRRRSASTSSISVAGARRRTSTSFDLTEPSTRPLLSIATIDSGSSIPSPRLSPLSSTMSANFRERRRRAAKLTQFFGVNYQDISESASQTFVASTPTQLLPTNTDSPILEVGVKVAAGRRFWGLSDGQMKNAEVADVLDKLRGLKAS